MLSNKPNQQFLTMTKVFIALLFCLLTFTGNTQSWNQFRGPNRNGAIHITEALTNWTEKQPELLWKKELGSGFSEILVQNNLLVTMCSDKTSDTTGSEYIIAFEANSGKELWKTKVDSIFIDVDSFGDGPRSTPALDQANAYCLSSYGKFYSIALNNGSVNWQINLMEEYESKLPRWAFCSSPLILESSIIIEIGGTDSRGFASIDKKSGSVKWIKGNAHPYYCSPTIAKINNITNLVFASDSMLISYNENGELLWSYRMPLRYPTATPLFIKPNKFFVSSAGNTGGFLIEINNDTPTQVFQSVNMKNHFSSSCHYNGNIYGYSNATLRCISADSAEIKWSKRGLGKGTLIKVGNKLLALSDKGVLKLIDANAEVYSELGSIPAITGKSWTAPSFANNCIYLRNLEEIAVYKVN